MLLNYRAVFQRLDSRDSFEESSGEICIIVSFLVSFSSVNFQHDQFQLLTVFHPHQVMPIHLFERVDADRSPSVELYRRDQVVVVDMDQQVVDKVMVDSQLVMVERRLSERLVLMHLVSLILLCFPAFQAYRANRTKFISVDAEADCINLHLLF